MQTWWQFELCKVLLQPYPSSLAEVEQNDSDTQQSIALSEPLANRAAQLCYRCLGCEENRTQFSVN
jgi:hypothetical protein